MAVIARKQLTGSTQKIKEYAGHEGQLVFDKQTKHLHVLSGTAGKTTELANKSDIPAPQDISGKADKTYVDQQLATKEAKGTAYSKVESDGKYSTKAEVTQGLAGKANTSHTHTKSQITDFPSIPDVSTLIPKGGSRGTLSGFETYTQDGSLLINKQSQDSNLIVSTQLTIEGPSTDECYTKVVHWNCGPGSTVTLPQNGFWSGGSAPEIKAGLSLVVVNAVYPYTIVTYQHYKDA